MRAEARVAFATLLENRDAVQSKDGVLTNCHVEASPEGPEVLKRPGTAFVSTFNCQGQGAFYFNGKQIFIACDTLTDTKFVSISASVKAGEV